MAQDFDMLDQPEVLFEDNDLIIVNKPSGFTSEGGSIPKTDLESWAADHAGKAVRCCHRLDRPTSGVLMMRKNNRLNRELAAIFESRMIRKSYWAITAGIWPRALTKLENRLAPKGDGSYQVVESQGKLAKSSIRILGVASQQNRSWLELILKTGRTHQARVQCAASGHPIIGDDRYGTEATDGFFGLHAREIRFTHPGTKEQLSVTAPPPASWDDLLQEFSQSPKN